MTIQTKLLTYEAILSDLGENLIKAGSAREALEYLLKIDCIPLILLDVNMPELDGFALAKLIREHPRYQQTAIIFISAVHLTHRDQLQGYAHGAVDYITAPIIPELLRAKVQVFAELYRKTTQLARLNGELEHRMAELQREPPSASGWNVKPSASSILRCWVGWLLGSRMRFGTRWRRCFCIWRCWKTNSNSPHRRART